MVVNFRFFLAQALSFIQEKWGSQTGVPDVTLKVSNRGKSLAACPNLLAVIF